MESFAAVTKTEQGGCWLLIGIALRRAHRVANHNHAERIPCAVNSRHGIRKTARVKYRVILRSSFCSDFETRLPTSRMHSSLTAIHHGHGHQVRRSAVARNIDVGHGSGSIVDPHSTKGHNRKSHPRAGGEVWNPKGNASPEPKGRFEEAGRSITLLRTFHKLLSLFIHPRNHMCDRRGETEFI